MGQYALGPLLSRTKDHSLEGPVRAGHVHLVHQGVVCQVPALLRTPVDDAQEPSVDESPVRLLEERTQVGVDRVHLEDDHPQVVEHLVEGVGGQEGGEGLS